MGAQAHDSIISYLESQQPRRTCPWQRLDGRWRPIEKVEFFTLTPLPPHCQDGKGPPRKKPAREGPLSTELERSIWLGFFFHLGLLPSSRREARDLYAKKKKAKCFFPAGQIAFRPLPLSVRAARTKAQNAHTAPSSRRLPRQLAALH